MLCFSLVSFSILKYSSFVTGFIAWPQKLSSVFDQCMLRRSWCFVMKWLPQSLPRPPSGKFSSNLCCKTALQCSFNLHGLSGKPCCAVSIVKLIMFSSSSAVSQLFFQFDWVNVMPPFPCCANVLCDREMCQPVSAKWASDAPMQICCNDFFFSLGASNFSCSVV